MHLIDHLSATSVSAEAIKDWTSKDPVLSQVRRYVMVGWPDSVPADVKPSTIIGQRSSALLMVVYYGELELLCHHKDVLWYWINFMRLTLAVHE